MTGRGCNILFDMDGTLIDPKEGIIDGVRYALNHYGVSVPQDSLLEKFIGPPLSDSFMEFCGFNEEKAKEAVTVYRAYYKEYGIFNCVLYDGVVDTLKTLSENGNKLFVATSKPQLFANMIADHFDITKYFVDIVGSEMNGERSKKVEVMRFILQKYKLDVKDTVMIGDRKFDILPAIDLGMKSVAVTYGYGSKAELQGTHPAIVVNNLTSLPDIDFKDLLSS